MSLNNEEKALIQEALQVYIQIVSRQFPPQQVQKIVEIAQNLVQKIEHLNAAGNGKNGGNKPAGITDEWYEHVCTECDHLTGSGCTEKVTEKYPGKCDPILHYERQKFLKSRQS